MARTWEEWFEIVKRDYHHLTEEAQEEIVDHMFKTHPDHRIRLVDPEPDRNSFWLRRIFWALLALIFATILAPHLHAQNGTSRIDVIKFQDSAGNPVGAVAAPFTLQVASGCTWSRSGSIWTIGCSTGTVTNNPGTPDKSIQYACSGAFCGVPEVHLGAVLIDQGPGVAPAFADPLIQGLTAHDAAGSSTNPVATGGYASAAAPADVSADGDIVRSWMLKSGAAVIQLSHAGTLYQSLTDTQLRATPVSVTPTATPNPSNLDVAASTLAKESGGNLAAIKTDVDKIPSQGQALAAASMPVVLPVAQITTLTPPAAITNFANETGGNLAASKADLDTIAGAVSSAKVATKSADGDNATLGAKADAKSAATDTTAVSAIQLLKEISFLLQNTLVVNGSASTQPVSGPLTDTQLRASAVPVSLASVPSHPVTNAGTFPVQDTGTVGDNGGAATTNRLGTLPAIAQATPPAAATAGRDAALLTDLHRVAYTSQMPTDVASYVASKQGLASAASATDIAVLSGNASNTVIVTKIMVSCTQTTAGIIDLILLKRSTADTAGTSTGSPTTVPLDSSNAGGVSSVLTYTANPTTGSLVGNVDTIKLGCMATGTTSPNDIYIWRPSMGQSIVLRGTAQQIAVNLNAATVTGGSFNITIQWIEATNY
jgi:hypothetical protein